MSKYPTYTWQKDTFIKGEWNNYLQSGFSQGLSLYSPEQDVKLFQKIDYDPINPNKINFDQLNDQLENRDFYDKGKALVQGVVDQVNKATDETEKDLKKTFNGVGNFVSNISSDIKLILGGLFLFFLLQRK